MIPASSEIRTASVAATPLGASINVTTYTRLIYFQFERDVQIHGVQLSSQIAIPATSFYLNVLCGLASSPSFGLTTSSTTTLTTPVQPAAGIHVHHGITRNIGSTDNLILRATNSIAFDNSNPLIVRSGQPLGIYMLGTLVFNPPPGDNYLGSSVATWFYSFLPN